MGSSKKSQCINQLVVTLNHSIRDPNITNLYLDMIKECVMCVQILSITKRAKGVIKVLV